MSQFFLDTIYFYLRQIPKSFIYFNENMKASDSYKIQALILYNQRFCLCE